ncbi:MAG TPA: hypothetical protein DGH68_03160, partial [Bacteroidetes bacterium]|nr:hypothetical protein [Bacteroidota bacterium]
MNRFLILLGVLVSIAMLDATSAHAATVTSAANGNWSAAATWTAGVSRTGTIAYSSSSTAVTGTGTFFTTELAVGSIITASNPQGITRTVASIIDNTHLTLTATAGNTASGKSFTSQGVGSGDAVIIDGGENVTVNVSNAVCASVQLGSPTGGGGAGTLTFAASSQLTVPGVVSLGNTGSVNRFGTITMTAGGTLRCGSISSNSTTDVFTEGTGTLELTATNTYPTADVGGEFSTLNNLTISAGTTTLLGSETVNGTLTLTSGLLVLGSNNLTLGASATIGGSPSASAMVVATGTGELRKTFAANGSFTFPVGDNTGTAEYSPVTLNFTSGSYASAYAAVRVTDGVHPNLASADYLTRYWTVLQSGISGFLCDATFTYLPVDVVGSEANIALGKWDGSHWSVVGTAGGSNTLVGTSLSSLSDFTGANQSALPIQLASFSGSVLQNGDVALAWVTLSEVNNYGFYMQRKRASEQEYFEIPNSFVAGHGTTNEPQTYNFTDAAPGSGTWMYRLKQVDLDGTIHFAEPIQIDVLTGVRENVGMPTVYELNQNYPNPF